MMTMVMSLIIFVKIKLIVIRLRNRVDMVSMILDKLRMIPPHYRELEREYGNHIN